MSEFKNYQLYRTNVRLGGQMKWDLVLNRIDGNLEVSDFHLTPLSNSVPYNKYSQDSLLNYPHYENVRKYYETIRGSFWSEKIDPIFGHDWPVVSEAPTDTHCSTFEMGCRRSRYGLYGKQFEFLVPVWLEKLDSDYSLQFTINIHSAPTVEGGKRIHHKPFASRTLDLRITPGCHKTHQRFVKYFSDYIDYTGLRDGDSNILDIRFDTKRAWLWGLEVSSGNMIQKDVSEIANNLIVRERPLLEFDSMIINTLANNNVIAKQLFNFNLCFNIEDILTPQLCGMLYGNKLVFSVDASIQPIDESTERINLPLMDFSSNHSFIKCERIGYARIPELEQEIPNKGWDPVIAPLESDVNALEYLHDNIYKDFITTNKYSPSIIHWSTGIGNGIFNTYNGLGGYINVDGEVFHVPHINGNVSSTLKTNNLVLGGDTRPTNVGWCTCIEMSWETMGVLSKLGSVWWDDSTTTGNQVLSKYASDFSNEWVNGLRYTRPFIPSSGPNAFLKVVLIHIKEKTGNTSKKMGRFMRDPGSDSEQFFNVFNNAKEYSGEKGPNSEYVMPEMYWMMDPEIPNMLYIISQDLDNLTFWNVREVLRQQIWEYGGVKNNYFSKTHGLLEELMNIMDSVEDQHIISFNKTIYPVRCDSPSLSSTEIEYYKNDLTSSEECYVIRYDGKITPLFVEVPPIIYYKDEVSSEGLKTSIYANYVRTKYPPVFPSIDYCALRSEQIKYDTPLIQTKSAGNYDPENECEYTWYNHGISVILPQTISAQLKSRKENGEYVKIEQLIEEMLGNKLFGDDASRQKLAEWAAQQYSITSSFEYDYNRTTPENPQGWLDGYVYNINMVLK